MWTRAEIKGNKVIAYLPSGRINTFRKSDLPTFKSVCAKAGIEAPTLGELVKAVGVV